MCRILQWLQRLSYQSEGVLYEDEQMQIGIKAEYHGNLGRIAMYLGNKIAQPFTSFSAEIECPEPAALSVTFHKPPANEVLGLTQVQHLLQIECSATFTSLPLIRISFIAGTVRNVVLRLPVFLTKFVEPVQLDAGAFFERWKVIGGGSDAAVPLFANGLTPWNDPRRPSSGGPDDLLHRSYPRERGRPRPQLQGRCRTKAGPAGEYRSESVKCGCRTGLACAES